MYMVWREGYQATFTLAADGKEYTRGLYPKCDLNLLDRTLEKMLKKGEITAYTIDWVKVQAEAGK